MFATMMSPATLIDLFRDYAKNQLKYHQNELEIRYKNPSAASVELVGEEFKKQQRIFEKELTDKIDELLAEDNQVFTTSTSGSEK